MDITTEPDPDAALLAQVESFLSDSGMAHSRFGLEAMGDGALVRQLREKKRSLSLKNAKRVLAYIRAQREAPHVAMCGACERHAADPAIPSCTAVGCPMKQREAA